MKPARGLPRWSRVALWLAIEAAIAAAVVLWPRAAQAQEDRPERQAVAAVGPLALPVGGGALLPLWATADWQQPHPEIEQVLVIQHGRARNGDTYFQTGLKARAAAPAAVQAATLVIAPQFLDATDAAALPLPPGLLRFPVNGWAGGEPALGPVPTASYAALDALFARLADGAWLPRLRRIVFAGHSGGGQLVQRYAIAGRAADALKARGIALRFVVANPSSYAWFDDQRPVPAVAAACPGYNDWRYGLQRRPAPIDVFEGADIERHYRLQDTVYLLGDQDTDPRHPVLDRTCMARAQGPHRWARGQAFWAHLQVRSAVGPLNQRLHAVPGVGHDGDRMFTSACGLSALFDLPGC